MTCDQECNPNDLYSVRNMRLDLHNKACDYVDRLKFWKVLESKYREEKLLALQNNAELLDTKTAQNQQREAYMLEESTRRKMGTNSIGDGDTPSFELEDFTDNPKTEDFVEEIHYFPGEEESSGDDTHDGYGEIRWHGTPLFTLIIFIGVTCVVVCVLVNMGILHIDLSWHWPNFDYHEPVKKVVKEVVKLESTCQRHCKPGMVDHFIQMLGPPTSNCDSL